MESLESKVRSKILMWRRFLDDIFILWTGSKEELEDFMCQINGFHETIKFTKDGDFERRSTHFLDVAVKIEDGKLSTDLFVKETAACAYLSPESWHPPHICKNIPYSLGFRLRRICSEEEDFIRRLAELKNVLISRGYKSKAIDGTFSRVKKLKREDCLQKVKKDVQDDKITFVTTFDKRIANMGPLVQKHLKTMCADPRMKEIFQNKIRIGYRRNKNLREILFRSRLYKVRTANIDRPLRTRKGWKTCAKCLVCLNSENRQGFTCKATKEVFKIDKFITCKTRNVIYICECARCGLQSVGKTSQSLQVRGGQHRRAVERGTDKNSHGVAKMYEHFQQKGHSAADMRFIAIEAVQGRFKNDEETLSARERFWIDKLQTVRYGLNTYHTT